MQVKRGDTLWALSLRYGVTMNQLAAANGMELSDLLVTGRALRIPVAARSGATARPPAAAAGSFCSTYAPPSGPRARCPACRWLIPSGWPFAPYS